MRGNKNLKDIEKNIQDNLDAIPVAEGSEENLREEEEERIKKLKEKGFSLPEIAEFVRKDVTLIKTSYQDRRHCFKERGLEPLFNRTYIEAELAKKIGKMNELPADKRTEAKNRLAIINFDLNGLKALNDIGGHQAGDGGLGIFAEILQKGEAVKRLKKQGVFSIPYTQGGDEFGLLISSDTVNIQEIKDQIKNDLVREIVSNEEAKKLITLDDEAVQKLKKERGADIPENFEFKLGASIGISTFSDAEKEEWLDKKIKKDEKFKGLKIIGNDNEFNVMRKMRSRMIVLADDLAIENKKETKEGIKNTGKVKLSDNEELEVGKELYTLYNIRSSEEVEKENKIKELGEKLDCLKKRADNEDLTACKIA